jgi:hypothetical protein
MANTYYGIWCERHSDGAAAWMKKSGKVHVYADRESADRDLREIRSRLAPAAQISYRVAPMPGAAAPIKAHANPNDEPPEAATISLLLALRTPIPEPLEAGSRGSDPHGLLVREYTAWCTRQGWQDIGSAEDELRGRVLTQAQREWLIDFTDRWDAALKWADAQRDSSARN